MEANQQLQAKVDDYASHALRYNKLGIVFNRSSEDVVKQMQSQVPVLREVEELMINASPAASTTTPTAASNLEQQSEVVTNAIIEGDNYHALTILNATHAGKFDVIYIDPPYNTGNKDFIYNDHYVDADDPYRHSQWLCFMERRLRLAKNLLTEDGVIFISIGEDECERLKLLADSIFGTDNFITNFIWEKTQHFGKQAKNYYSTADYVLAYAKKLKSSRAKENEYQLKELLVERVQDEFEDAPLYNGGNPVNTLTFPKGSVKFNIADGEYTKTTDAKYKLLDKVVIRQGYNSKPFSLRFHSRWSQQRVEKELQKGSTFWVKSTNFAIRAIYGSGKLFNDSPKQIIFTNRKNEFCAFSRIGEKVGTSEEGTSELARVIGEKGVFSYPKPKSLISYLLSLYYSPDKQKHPDDIIVLDFFAGSGTTAQAVMELNAEDGGNRQFVLVTNNEGGEAEDGNDGIARKVCYPRVKKVIEGYTKYKAKGEPEEVKGLPNNVKYYQIDFVDRLTDNEPKCLDQLRVDVATKLVDTIKFTENAFTRVAGDAGNSYCIFSNGDYYTAIILKSGAIGACKLALAQIKDSKAARIYVFSFSSSTQTDSFKDLQRPYQLTPIPEKLLSTYKLMAEKELCQ